MLGKKYNIRYAKYEVGKNSFFVGCINNFL